MSRTAEPLSFSELLAQCTPDSFLIETKRGPEFRAPGWLISRCCEHIFMGTNFNIEKSAPALFKRVEDFLNKKNAPLIDLECMTKVLLYTKRKFSGILATPVPHFQKEYIKSVRDSLVTQGENLTSRALEKLAQRKKLSMLQLCLDLGAENDLFLEEAYTKVKDIPDLQNLSQKNLDLVSRIAHIKIDMGLILKVLGLGWKPTATALEKSPSLFIAAISHLNDKALATLIRAGYKWDFSFSSDSNSFIFSCLEFGMIEAIEAIVEKKEPLLMRDSKGNTPLHYAFLYGNTHLAQILGQVTDPTVKNKHGQTPLVCALKPKGKTAQNLTSQNPDKTSFLNELFADNQSRSDTVRVTSHRYHNAIKGVLGNTLAHLKDDVELAFLVGSEEASHILCENLSEEKFEIACEALRKKYPKTAVERFIVSSYSLNEGHFLTGCELATLSNEVEGNPDPAELLDLLKKVGTFSRSERSILASFLDKIKNRAENFGAYPRGSPSHEDYCHQIEVNLKHIVFALKQKNDHDLTKGALKELIEAYAHCAGRWYASTLEVAQRVYLGLEMDPLSTLQRSLGNFRAVCLEGAVTQVYTDDHNVNSYTAAVRDLGQELGIPGVPATPYDDRCSPHFFPKEDIRARFMRIYTPESIIFDWLLPKLKDDIKFRNSYVDLLKKHVPEDWTVSDATSEPSKEEKAYDFLEKAMYDEENQLQISTISYLLEKLGVIQCVLAKERKESSRVTRKRKPRKS